MIFRVLHFKKMVTHSQNMFIGLLKTFETWTRKVLYACSSPRWSCFNHCLLFTAWASLHFGSMGCWQMMKYFHQMNLGSDEKPSWQPGCYKLLVNQLLKWEKLIIVVKWRLWYQTKRCTMLSGKSYLTMHNFIKKIKPKDA